METVAAIFMSVGTPRFIVPVKIKMRFFEPNARRDRDNVSSGGAKIILDAMKHLGVIVDDSRRWVQDIQHDTTMIDRRNPRVEVDIIED